MSNDFGFNWYCDGGDEGMAFQWLQMQENTAPATVELDSDYPIEYEELKNSWSNGIPLQPKLPSD